MIAGLLLTALACASHTSTGSPQQAFTCRLDDRDRQVLRTVLEQVVLGSGVCAESGPVLLYESTVSPGFPETVEEAQWRREIDARLAAGESVDAEDLAAAPPVSGTTDLSLDKGMTLEGATVRSMIDRQGCEVGDLDAPAEWRVSELEAGIHDALFAGDVPNGWQRLRKRFPEMGCLVKLSAPGYVEDSNQAVVSYSRMSGPLSGMGGFVVLRRVAESWQIDWVESLWVA